MTLTFIFLAVTAIFLIRNYSKDNGRHTVAKIVHAIVLVLIIVIHENSIEQVGYLIQHFPEFKARHLDPVGVVPGELNLITSLLHEILSALILFSALSTVKRTRRSVTLLRALLVISVPVTVIDYYCLYLTSSTDLPDWMVFGRGAIVIAAIYFGIFLLYSARFMREFFRSPEGVSVHHDTSKEQA
ncbi:MAG: hypothetical protein IPP83_08765 [Flavobacteriales bacterium]|nr:hypothetical protein [Flavobacteriales bacterium]